MNCRELSLVARRVGVVVAEATLYIIGDAGVRG